MLRLWEGLGYYRRARHLHAAARRLVAEHGGALPDDPAVWAELPGVGRYILGAVLSQAFDRRLPIVEANSLRVLCRLFGYRGDPRHGEVKAGCGAPPRKSCRASGAGDFNQALMELGALVCTPAKPRCGECPLRRPVRRLSRWPAGHDPARRPPSRRPWRCARSALVVRKAGRGAARRRPRDAGAGRTCGSFRTLELAAGESEHARRPAAAGRHHRAWTAELGPELLTIRHGVTRFRITMACLEATWTAGRFHSPFYAEARWLRPAELTEYAVSSPQRKLAREVAAEVRQRRLF